MDKLGCGPSTRSILRKDKKKNAKGEIDRVRQAEKKKRHLEKALATSAAIRSELEKKKLKKMEEQQHLDEEGAAIAESVALLVLGEDSYHNDNTILNGCRAIDLPDDTVTAAHPMDYSCLKICSVDGLGKFSSGYRSGMKWNNQGIGWQLHAQTNGLHPQIPCISESSEARQVLTGMSASSAFEFDEESQRGTHYLLNRIMNAGHLGKEVCFYQEYYRTSEGVACV